MKQRDFKQTEWRGRILRYAPLVLWVGVVFFVSSNAGSMSNTSTFIRPILEFFFPNSPEATLIVYHGYIRKSAHFAEFSVLAFIAVRAFWNSSRNFLRNYRFFNALAVVALVASADEFNQSFNSARTGSVYDVMIDVSGGFTMVLFLWIGKKRLTK